MSTTNLFVELIVIGVGALVWVSLVVLAAFGWQWVPADRVFSTEALLFFVAIIYLLGIVTDRIADASIERLFGNSLRRGFFSDPREYHRSRLIILSRSERLAQLLEYGRSRLRICRGWAFNSLLAAVCLNIFLWTRVRDESFAAAVSVFGTIVFCLLAATCFYSWKKLVITEYVKTKEQSGFLLEAEPKAEARAPRQQVHHRVRRRR